MGLNDLTLEKLISEINGYKEKMRTIHEDYGRASQDLQDRINVLGYTLNDHLKETKDQIANTPQRLLNLETKYVTGEVNESEYRTQREEFKGLLQRNLQSIEEIRQMIDVLSHIETKPLAPAEFKQTYANAPKPATGEEWGRGAFIQEKTSNLTAPLSFTAQNASTAGLRIAPQITSPDKGQVEITTRTASPSPPQQQSGGAPWISALPTNAPTATPALSVEAPGTPEPVQVEAPSQPTVIDTAAGTDYSMSASSATDVAEDVADALVVKVVDDTPVIEASSAVVTDDTAQIQTPVPGTESAPGIPSTPDVAQVSLTPPSQFYKVVCPKCGADVPKPVKVWELKGGKSKKNVLIGLFQCQDCRVKFREALTREIL